MNNTKKLIGKLKFGEFIRFAKLKSRQIFVFYGKIFPGMRLQPDLLNYFRASLPVCLSLFVRTDPRKQTT